MKRAFSVAAKKGICPKCGTGLHYKQHSIDSICYQIRVDCPICEWEGAEEYKLVFKRTYEFREVANG
jgi:ssDNA-binding Zn-finger/Zn-ribbon topoisomerase 1